MLDDRSATPKRPRGTFEYALRLVANVAALVLINLYPVWRPWTRGVVTEDWARAVWAANLAAVLQIGGNAVLLATRPRWLTRGLELAFAAAALLSASVFYVVYPFDFARLGVSWLDPLAHAVLVLGIIGAALAVFVELMRFLRPGSGPRITPIGPSGGYR